MTDAPTVTEVEFAGFFQSWQRLEEQKAELAEEAKDLFAHMKAKGYDTKAARAVFRDMRNELNADAADRQKAEEAEAVYGLYWTALKKGMTGPRAHPARSARENIEEFPPASARKTAGSAPHEMGSDDANIGDEDVEGSATRAGHAGQTRDALSGQVETRNSDDFIERTTSGPDAKRATNSPSAPSSSRAAEQTGAAVPPLPAAPVTPSNRAEIMRRYRPNCQRPDACSSSVLDHCYSCKKAMAESEAA